MAYNRRNYLARIRHIVEVYNQYKNPDVPDTRIVSNYFPRHGIFISYRTWMNIKGVNFAKETPQLSLFELMEPLKTNVTSVGSTG